VVLPIFGITMTAYQLGYFTALAACSIGGYKICENKGRDPWLGAALGFFLGLIGLIIAAVLKEDKSAIGQAAAGAYMQSASGPAFPVQPAQSPPPAVPVGSRQAVASGGQAYVAPRVPQYAAPHPPQPPAGSQPS
jgi:hypothetical protein